MKYTKRVLKMGDRSTYPMKGDTVECFYTGKLDSGKIFDTNVEDSESAIQSVIISQIGITDSLAEKALLYKSSPLLSCVS